MDGHADDDEHMPGMASDAQLDELPAAGSGGRELFIDLMIAHHQGGIHMARRRDVARRDGPRTRRVVEPQAGEIDELEALTFLAAPPHFRA